MASAASGGSTWAHVLEAPVPAAQGPLRWRERPVPDVGPDQVLIEVEACAVCRTDLQLCEGDLPARRLPVVPGHQVVGVVRDAGPGEAHLVGRRVGLVWLAGTCGACRFCASGRENLCEAATFTGWDRDGGFARLVTAAAAHVHPLPTGPAATLAPLLCGGVIGYRSLRVAGVEPGQRVGLYGFGASATVVIQIARHWGCTVAVATRNAAERQRAVALGADWVGGYDERPPFPLDAAITFAPSGDVVIRALEAVDRGGVVAVNAIHLDRIPAFDYQSLWWERSLRSVANVTRADAQDLLALAAEVPLTTHVQPYDLADANRALLDLREGRVVGAAVLVA